MHNVNIIGGSGFIETRLIRRLLNNDLLAVRIIDKVPNKEFPDLVTLSDVRSLEQIKASVTDGAVIINLAAEHRDDVRPLSLYAEVNIGGAKKNCTVACEKGVKTIIFTSIVAVYGFAPIGTDESGEIAPFNDYGRTKFEAEQVFKAW